MAYEKLGWPLNLISEMNHLETKDVFVNAYQLEECINDLRGRYYDILIGHYKKGKSFKRIAKELGISESRVGELRNQGLRKLNVKSMKNRYLGVSVAKRAADEIFDDIFNHDLHMGKSSFIYKDISDLGLSARTRNVLIRNGIKKVNDLGKLGKNGAEIEKKLTLTRGIGKNMMAEIEEKLSENGYAFDKLALEVER